MALLGRDQVLLLLASPRGETPPLYGQHIGEVDFAGHTFEGTADFTGARFTRSAHFERAVFRGPAHFGEVVFFGEASFLEVAFERGANFAKAVFHQVCDFSNSRFVDRAYFWRARFRGAADFLSVVVDTAADVARGRLFPGEANFSWAWFSEKATFTRAHFHGPVFFWRTLFGSDALFDETVYDGRAVFNGTRTEVQLSRHEFANPPLLDDLAGCGFLRADPEEQIVVGGKKFPVFFQFAGVGSRQEVTEKLAALGGIPTTPQVEEEFGRIWDEGSKEMFADPGRVTFRGAEFKKPDAVEVTQVNVDVPVSKPANPLDAVEIKPGAFGVSVDVKQLFRSLREWCGRIYRRIRGRR